MGESKRAFLAHVQPLSRKLDLVARQYAGTGPDACDLVQETLLRAWQHFSSAEQTAFPAAWLFVIMRNIAYEWRRVAGRRIRLVPVPESELTDVEAVEPGAPLLPLPPMDEQRFREFLDDRILAALDDIEPSFREVLLLSVAGELTYREISRVLDCPLGTVMSRMARARRQLRERLAVHAKSVRGVTEVAR